jgi:Domain of unknown function (DUF4062)
MIARRRAARRLSTGSKFQTETLPDEERKKFRHVLEKCSAHHGYEKDVMFHPVGWEDTIGGAGRPQEQINEDLERCDYAVFVLHDRWGSPTGSGDTSGTEEEWALAEELYKATKIRNVALFFKQVDAGKLRDPGERLKPLLAFKKEIDEDADRRISCCRALFDALDRGEEAIVAYDDVLARFGAATELPLREQVANAQSNKDSMQIS